MVRFKKGSEAAKRYMAKIRGMRKGGKSLHHYVKKAKSRARRAETRMARRRSYGRRGHRRSKSIVGSVEKIIGAGAFAFPAVARANAVWNAEHNGGRALLEGVSQYAGVKDGNFDWGVLAAAWTPFIGFNVVRYGAHKLIGLIRKV